jgi:hypothetical protein
MYNTIVCYILFVNCIPGTSSSDSQTHGYGSLFGEQMLAQHKKQRMNSNMETWVRESHREPSGNDQCEHATRAATRRRMVRSNLGFLTVQFLKYVIINLFLKIQARPE